MAASFEQVQQGLNRIAHRSSTLGLLGDAMRTQGNYRIANALETLMHDIDVELEEVTDMLVALENAS